MVDDSLERAEARVVNNVFQRISWDELTQIISSGHLELLTRSPSDLKEYHTWKQETVKTHGSIERYILTQRLRWDSLDPVSKIPFNDPHDYKVLVNDFPYAVTPDIQHLVIWLKTPLPRTGDTITLDARDRIQKFVDGLGGTSQWFLNPPTLKSIEGLEHFHVMIKR